MEENRTDDRLTEENGTFNKLTEDLKNANLKDLFKKAAGVVGAATAGVVGAATGAGAVGEAGTQAQASVSTDPSKPPALMSQPPLRAVVDERGQPPLKAEPGSTAPTQATGAVPEQTGGKNCSRKHKRSRKHNKRSRKHNKRSRKHNKRSRKQKTRSRKQKTRSRSRR